MTVTTETTAPEVTVAQAKAMMAEHPIAVADIRHDVAFLQGHIDGAVLVNNTNVADFINDHQDHKVLVVCFKGISSKQAAQYMISQGLEAYSLIGGMDAWNEALAP